MTRGQPRTRAVPDIGRDASNQLRRLLPLKTRAEYDPAPVSSTDAMRAVEQAEKLVALARRVLSDRLGISDSD
jgi:negative regulator of replication initiation